MTFLSGGQISGCQELGRGGKEFPGEQKGRGCEYKRNVRGHGQRVLELFRTLAVVMDSLPQHPQMIN